MVEAFGMVLLGGRFGFWDCADVQLANFGRVYAAYGGVFIVLSIAWGRP